MMSARIHDAAGIFSKELNQLWQAFRNVPEECYGSYDWKGKMQ